MKEEIEILVLSSKGHGKQVRTTERRSEMLRPGQRVRICGEKEIFTVLRIDLKRHLVDLLHEGAMHKVEAGIPISALRVFGEPDESRSEKISA
jgi:hypothetical protein